LIDFLLRFAYSPGCLPSEDPFLSETVMKQVTIRLELRVSEEMSG
jgi:hypothetical protein